MWIPLSLQGTAIGLLLVFRTNNAYVRLAEAREQWGKLLMLLREMTTKTSVALGYGVTCEACRYLCAFTWSLRDKLRDGEVRNDILNLLLGKEEAEWVASQRSRPLAILSRLRRLVYAEYEAGNLDSQIYYFLETDIKEIDTVIESCERLFSSPIPPNMARHGMRSLTLWILALPVVLTRSMPAILVAVWTSITAYIYLGIDELGTQVEQPFKIMPLWQLCHLAQLNVEEALSTPDLPLRLNRVSEATPSPLECQSGIPFGV
jgi:putative membrane protein